jgi:ribosomal protein S18 acetylase RimI-like enzyme
MPALRAVDKAQIHRAFLEAFADYAMDASGTTEEGLLLRMRKNAVDYGLSPGLYDGDRLVGFTLIGIDTWGGRLSAYDAGTGIVPAFREQGWAKRMFEHALPPLRERGVERFVLEVLQQNESAIKAYRKSGFEIARALKCYVGQASELRTLAAPPDIEIRPIARADLARIERSADWIPSFENRFSAVDAIPDSVQLAGALVDGVCVGATAHAPPLNWLLTVVVDRAHRRRGVGTALVARLAGTLPASVTRLPALNVDGTDTGTRAFFESLGFSHLVDQYEMVRDL